MDVNSNNIKTNTSYNIIMYNKILPTPYVYSPYELIIVISFWMTRKKTYYKYRLYFGKYLYKIYEK